MPKIKKCCNCQTELNPHNRYKWCSPNCGFEWAKKLQAKKEAKEWKAEKKVLKEKLKTLSDYENEAKKVFQKWVRQRDAELSCISCGCETSNQWAGGHYFDAGIYSGLMFHEWNVNKQCNNYCNKNLGGNKPNYRIGLVKKIGEENVLWLEENKDRLRNYKFTKQELIEIKNKYQKLLR